MHICAQTEHRKVSLCKALVVESNSVTEYDDYKKNDRSFFDPVCELKVCLFASSVRWSCDAVVASYGRHVEGSGRDCKRIPEALRGDDSAYFSLPPLLGEGCKMSRKIDTNTEGLKKNGTSSASALCSTVLPPSWLCSCVLICCAKSYTVW